MQNSSRTFRASKNALNYKQDTTLDRSNRLEELKGLDNLKQSASFAARQSPSSFIENSFKVEEVSQLNMMQ